MNFNKIPKFVINLKKREDRLVHIRKEMEYIGWDFELFEAVDEGCHVGCTKSHLNIVSIAKERGYKEVLVIEDDCTFMPYSKNFIEKINDESGEFDYAVCNLSPTLNRPVNRCEKNNLFLDITNLPEKKEHHRDIFATNMILYNESIYNDLFHISGSTFSSPYYYPIDEYIFNYIVTKKQSYSTILPIAPQMKSWSDVSQGEYSNFYTQTYNWNSYSPCKIPGEYMDFDRNQIEKESKNHKNFYYVS